MAIKARAVINQAKGLLNDPNGKRWPDSDLIGYLNDGQRRVLTLIPASKAVKKTIQLASGVVQNVPSDLLAISNFVRNMGAAGATPGLSIEEMSRDLLDDMFPGWAADGESGDVMFCMYDRRSNPKIFETYPPQPNPANFIEVEAAEHPTDCTLSSHDGEATGSADSSIDLGDQYADALLYFIMWKAHSRDFRYAVRGLAENYWNKMLSELGLSNQREVAEAKKIKDGSNDSGV